MKKFALDKTFLKFLLVGVCNTVAGSIWMFLLFNLAGWSYWQSSAASYIIGSIISFFLNKHFTFQKKEWSWKQAGKFALTVAICYLLAYGIAKPLALQILAGQTVTIQENAAMLVGMCLYTGLNYLGQRFFAFT